MHQTNKSEQCRTPRLMRGIRYALGLAYYRAAMAAGDAIVAVLGTDTRRGTDGRAPTK